jgi:hypothetical protein
VRRPPRPVFDIAICDVKAAPSSLVSWIAWKPADISLYSFIEPKCLHAVNFSKMAIEHDLVAANKVDFPLDEFAGNGRKLFSVMFVGHENIGLITEKPTIRSYFVDATAAARLLYSRS